MNGKTIVVVLAAALVGFAATPWLSAVTLHGQKCLAATGCSMDCVDILRVVAVPSNRCDSGEQSDDCVPTQVKCGTQITYRPGQCPWGTATSTADFSWQGCTPP
jgi:hypothetical protein